MSRALNDIKSAMKSNQKSGVSVLDSTNASRTPGTANNYVYEMGIVINNRLKLSPKIEQKFMASGLKSK